MSSIVAVVGSPSNGSRTMAVATHLARQLYVDGHDVRAVAVGALPAEALLGADNADPRIADLVSAVAGADGLIVGSPVYQASYSGVLKAFLDLLPAGALAGKAVLPLLTGAAPAHGLAVDYALRPVLVALGASPVVSGLFVIDKQIGWTAEDVVLDPAAEEAAGAAVAELSAALPVAKALR